MNTMSEVLEALRRYFLVQPKNKLIPFLYYLDPKDWEVLQETQQLRYVYKEQLKGAIVFVYEVLPPEFDEEICLLSYEHKEKETGVVVTDGFPRMLTMKKCFSDKEYRE